MQIEEYGTPKVNKKDYFDLMGTELLPKFNDEINEKLGSNYWNELLKQGILKGDDVFSFVNDHEVCKHIINVLH